MLSPERYGVSVRIAEDTVGRLMSNADSTSLVVIVSLFNYIAS